MIFVQALLGLVSLFGLVWALHGFHQGLRQPQSEDVIWGEITPIVQTRFQALSLDELIARYVDEALDVPVLEGVDYKRLERKVWAALHLYETDRGRAILAHEFSRVTASTPRPAHRDPGVKTWE